MRQANTAGHSGVDNRHATLSCENRVRRDLLCMLGIDVETQERFVRAASTRQESSTQLSISAVAHGEHQLDDAQVIEITPTVLLHVLSSDSSRIPIPRHRQTMYTLLDLRRALHSIYRLHPPQTSTR